MSEFDDALAIRWADANADEVHQADRPAPPSRPIGAVTLTQGWLIGGAINGGILMAIATRALVDVLDAAGGHLDPLAWSTYFVSAAEPGEARVEVEIIRSGRTVSTGQVTLLQERDGHWVERLRLLAPLGALASMAEPVRRAPERPAMPDPEHCPRAERTSEFAKPIRLLDRVDIRIDPSSAGFAVGAPSGRGVLRAWLRFADGRPVDLAALPFVVDAFPPVAFDLGLLGWAPTLELTGELWGVPAPGWLQVELTTAIVAGSLLEEDATVWDSTGRVVARSRQLAGVRFTGGADSAAAPPRTPAGGAS